MQANLDRHGVFYFVPFLPDVVLSPLSHFSFRALGAKILSKNTMPLMENQ